MKATLLFVWVAVCCRADEAADRTAIEKVVAGLNDASQRETLFAADADAAEAIRRLAGMEPREVWSETTPPFIRAHGTKFITADVALVDASQSQIGTYGTRGRPLVIVLRRDSGQWRIAALRALP